MDSTYPHRWSAGAWRSTGPALAALLLCTFTQCVCQSTREDPEPTGSAEAGPDGPKGERGAPPAKAEETDRGSGPALPEGLDTRDLDAAERTILAEILREQFDPCGEPRSFLESLEAADTCERAEEMGAFTVGLVQKGLSKRQITRELLDEMARTSVKAEFQLEGSPHLGDPAAEHVLVEYIDFQCPACRLASEEVKALAKAHDDVVLYVKHLPLGDHHPHAERAAKASLAADRQGRFWEIHDLLFEHQARLSPEVVRELAEEVGLDMDRFDADIDGAAVGAILTRDVEEADRYEIPGTPTFFLDGHMLDLERLEAAVDRATND